MIPTEILEPHDALLMDTEGRVHMLGDLFRFRSLRRDWKQDTAPRRAQNGALYLYCSHRASRNASAEYHVFWLSEGDVAAIQPCLGHLGTRRAKVIEKAKKESLQNDAVSVTGILADFDRRLFSFRDAQNTFLPTLIDLMLGGPIRQRIPFDPFTADWYAEQRAGWPAGRCSVLTVAEFMQLPAAQRDTFELYYPPKPADAATPDGARARSTQRKKRVLTL